MSRFTTSVSDVYPHYIAKVEKKGRRRDEFAEGKAVEKVMRDAEAK